MDSKNSMISNRMMQALLSCRIKVQEMKTTELLVRTQTVTSLQYITIRWIQSRMARARFSIKRKSGQPKRLIAQNRLIKLIVSLESKNKLSATLITWKTTNRSLVRGQTMSAMLSMQWRTRKPNKPC